MDCQLSSQWKAALESIPLARHGHGNVSPHDRAVAFASALCRTSMDASTTVNDSLVPAAALAFKPQSQVLHQQQQQASRGKGRGNKGRGGGGGGGGGGGASTASNSSGGASGSGGAGGGKPPPFGTLVTVDAEVAIPSRRRMYWLPPAVAGANGVDLGPAAWIAEVVKVRWVPVIDTSSTGVTTLYPPSQVLLERDPARPDMPIANFPSHTVRSLLNGPLAEFFGTETPPPPVERLLSVIKDATAASERGGGGGGSSSASNAEMSTLASEMVSLWRSVAKASVAGKLSSRDRGALEAAAKSGGAVLPTLGLPVYGERHDHNGSHPADRDRDSTALYLVPSTRAIGRGGGSDLDALSVALCEASYLLNIGDRRWYLHDVSDEIAKILSIAKQAGARMAQQFIIHRAGPAKSSPPSSSALSSLRGDVAPRPSERTALLLSLHATLRAVKSQEKDKDKDGAGLSKALRKAVPNLHLHCEGMQRNPHDTDGDGGDGGGRGGGGGGGGGRGGGGGSPLVARWLPVFPKKESSSTPSTPSTPTTPSIPSILINDAPDRVEFLRPQHGFQVGWFVGRVLLLLVGLFVDPHSTRLTHH